MIKICAKCDMEFETPTRSLCCGPNCRSMVTKEQQRKTWAKKHLVGVAECDLVECKLCNKTLKSLSGHLRKVHGISSADYDGVMVGDSTRKKMSDNVIGDKNPGYNHGGRLSPWSKNSSYYNSVEVLAAKENAVLGRTPEKLNTSLEFYLAKGMSVEDAKRALSNRQTTFSLETCIAKYGEDGHNVFAARQQKWHNSYTKSNFSMISQEVFWHVVQWYTDISNVFFAELDAAKEKDYSGMNHEYVLRLRNTTIKPDFIDVNIKKIIEFDGDYWHGEKRGNQERDALRDDAIIAEGYEVLHIKEREARKDMGAVVKECLEFLNG